MLLAIALLLADPLPSQPQLEAAAREAVAGTCGRKVSIDRDLTRACHAYTAAARTGKAPLSGLAVSFYASLESAEPAPVAGIARMSQPERADRAIGDLFPKSCRFNRVGVSADRLPDGE
ncbi:MAG: hypothetical protein ACXWLM_07690, partial [Myxococcales bacterium]